MMMSNARALAAQYAAHHHLSITFLDCISVVPNYAPNFSINRMVRSAHEHGIIKFSSGGDYGRPLLHSSQAGELVASLIERRRAGGELGNNDNGGSFETVLVPGHFVPFQTFARIAKAAVLKKYGRKENDITFQEYEETPDELRTRCISAITKDWFVCNSALVELGLEQSAQHSLEHD